MRVKLIACVIVSLFSVSVMASQDLLFEAESTTALLSWAKARFGGVNVVPLKTSPVETLVMVVDTGSGLTLKTAFVYVRTHADDARWSLITVLRTELSELRARVSKNHIVILSGSDGSEAARIDVRVVTSGWVSSPRRP